MNSKRLKLILVGLLGVSCLLFIIICALGLSLLSGKSKSMVNLKIESMTLEAQSTSLAIAQKQVESYGYFKDVAKTVIPNDKDQAQAVLDIFQLANEAGISLQGVTFPASTLGVKSTSVSGTTAAADASSAAAKTVLSQAKAVEGISGLYSIELTITPETGPNVPDDKRVTYSKLLDFLDRIEHNRRTAQITQVNIQPQGVDGGTSQHINFTMTINIFIKP